MIVYVKHGRRVVDAFVDDEDYALVAARSWHVNSHGYPTSADRINGRKTTIKMHELIIGRQRRGSGLETDHRNGNRLDNRRRNLRVVTHAANLANRPHLNRNNTSGLRGVVFDKDRGKWRAQVKVQGRNRLLGRYATAAEAGDVVAAFWREFEALS